MAALFGRQAALEGSYFFAEEQRAVAKMVEQMVSEGKLPQSALEAMQSKGINGSSSAHTGTYAGLPTTVINSNPDFVYNHVKQRVPSRCNVT